MEIEPTVNNNFTFRGGGDHFAKNTGLTIFFVKLRLEASRYLVQKLAFKLIHLLYNNMKKKKVIITC